LKIVLVGASGTIGKAIVKELGARHEIVAAGSRTGDVRLDITDPVSIRTAYRQIGRFDAVVCAAGRVHFAPLASMTADYYAVGLKDKLMGQVNLVLLGLESINDGGSFTLTSGVLTDDPIVSGSSASMVNGAIEAWVGAAAIELPRGIRINVVSPGVLVESMDKYASFFRGHEPVPASRAALAYSKSVEGAQTGKVYRVL